MSHAHVDNNHGRELQQLEDRVTAMGAEVCTMLERTLAALSAGDHASARDIIAADKISRLETETDEMCLAILGRRQPVGPDLRFVATTLKADKDLERIGDLCVNVCERSLQLSGELDAANAARLAHMGGHVRRMLETALRALAARDADLAESVLDTDDVIDKAYADRADSLATEMARSAAGARDGLRVRSIARHLECMGDHATNFAEMVIFMVECA